MLTFRLTFLFAYEALYATVCLNANDMQDDPLCLEWQHSRLMHEVKL